MVMKSGDYPKWSDWSVPQSDDSQNPETVDVNQTGQSELLYKPIKCWPSCMSPFLQGLLLGILMNGATLAVVLTFWLKPHYNTGVIITNELPPGTILLFGGNLSTLTGSTYQWLLCDGSEVSRLTYRDLFDVIGVIHGSGNGNDTFNLPDFRARFPLGSNSSNVSELVAGGASSHVMTVAELPVHSHDPGSLQILVNGSHTHSYVDPGHNHGGSTGTGPFSHGSFAMLSSGGSGNDGGVHSHGIPTGTTGITIQSNGDHTHSLQGLTGSQGLNQPIDMMPSYQIIHYIIRA